MGGLRRCPFYFHTQGPSILSVPIQKIINASISMPSKEINLKIRKKFWAAVAADLVQGGLEQGEIEGGEKKKHIYLQSCFCAA